jgi:hypothetical protein
MPGRKKGEVWNLESTRKTGSLPQKPCQDILDGKGWFQVTFEMDGRIGGHTWAHVLYVKDESMNS